MDGMRDVIYACRHLRRTPGFAVAAILTLGLGIGVTTAVVTVANAVLLRPLPYGNADRLVRFVDEPSPGDGLLARVPTSLAPEEFDDLRARVRTLAQVGVFVGATTTLTGRGDAAALTVTRMSAAFFDLLGEQPVLGRGFEPADEAAGAPAVVVLSHGAWQRWFGGAPHVLGERIRLDGQPVTVVGIMPASFAFPDALTEAWVPFHPAPVPGRSQRFYVYGALGPDVPLADASAEVSAILQEMRGFPTPDEYRAAGEPLPFAVVSWKDDLVAPVGPALRLLVVAAGLVLLLACVNVSTLLLARGTSRLREVATRLAMGASRGRVVRQLLTESLVLAGLGGVVGLAVAAACVRVLVVWGTSLPRRDLGPGVSLPRLDEVHIDPTALAIVAALVTLSAVLAGLWPAVRLSRFGTGALLASTLHQGAGGTRRLLVHGSLMTAQVALAVALLVGGALAMRSFSQVLRADLGFDSDRVLTMRLAFPAGRYARESLEAFSHRVVEQLRAVPGVREAAYGNLPLVQSRAGGRMFTVPQTGGGRQEERDASASLDTLNMWVHHAYAPAMGLRVVAGRSLSPLDDESHPRVVMVNEALVATGVLGANPVGRPVYFSGSADPWEVVGVVHDFARFGIGVRAGPELYFDARQRPALPGAPGRGPYLIVRAEGPPLPLLPSLRAALRTVDPDASLMDIATMDAIVGHVRSRPRLYAGLMGVFAFAALLMAASGIVGVVAYAVAQRRREIGIRLALGATPARVVGECSARALWHAALGLVLGVVGALGLVQYLESLLVGVSPLDPWAFAVAATTMAVTCALATLLPARRAARVDPAETLRTE